MRVRVRGLVQGVGFRPFVHGAATRLGLAGWVRNDAEGVLLEAEGDRVGELVEALSSQAPSMARVDAVEVSHLPALGDRGFAITESVAAGPLSVCVPPDVAPCDDCLIELFDPAARRYRYPFTSCAHCGPRYTITRALPYDRPQTSMAGFRLCDACLSEYNDPADRRFHAQPLACPACGPRLSMPLDDIVARLLAGRIVALKGVGGFLLACDAHSDDAVARLRAAKHRDARPFAVMVQGRGAASALADLSQRELDCLASPERPVLIARQRQRLAEGVAPGLAWVGVMLPSSPLHHLLFHEAAGRPSGLAWLDTPCELALVMTSGNVAGEPIITDDDEARRRLSQIADDVVGHDRPIVARADDPVARVVAGSPRLLRRARGYTPRAIPVAVDAPPVLALGASKKSAICLLRGREAFVSTHIGDLDDSATEAFFDEVVAHLQKLIGAPPALVAHDLHPGFASSEAAISLGLPTLAVQHHHAHVASVLAEHRRTTPAAGLALDGFGLGPSGEAWGGELLLLDGAGFERLGGLRPLSMPGGDAAAREGWRMGAAALHALGRADEIEARFGGEGPASAVRMMLDAGLRSRPTSSCGRLFDAAAALLGVCTRSRYEGEAAMRLEGAVLCPEVLEGGFVATERELDLLPLLGALPGLEPGRGASLFHGTLASGLVAFTLPHLARAGLREVALSGGCMHNRVLAELLVDGFARQGVTALLPSLVPAGDGGLCLGQAWVAARHLSGAC